MNDTLELTTPVASEPGTDNLAVAALAQGAIIILRQNGLSDDEIRERFLLPHDVADARFEALQRQERGFIVAPAADVKREMARLLAN